MKYNDVLFLTLKVFSATGGIEKVCRVAGKALYEYSIEKDLAVQVYTMHGHKDAAVNNRYFPSEMFRGFGGKRIRCIIASVKKGYNSKLVMMSHINLLLIGWMIKKISPSTKLVLFAHGIEVWKPLNPLKRMMLKSCDEIISVSQYTNQKMQELHHIPKEKCRVLNNCLDPFLPQPVESGKNEKLLLKYGFKAEHKILFTLTRLSSKERFKGYDKVLESLVELKTKYPETRYLIGGSFDYLEKTFLDERIRALGLTENVAMSGFIPDEQLASYFKLADIYVMPSMKEGFGIVFIEAMYYGLPVIAGNADGSVDALGNGKFGLMVDPQRKEELTAALSKMLDNRSAYLPDQAALLEQFSYTRYKENLQHIIGAN